MSILGNYFKNFKIIINDKFEGILDKWNNSGKSLIKNINEENYDINNKKINLPIIEKNLQNYFLNVFNNNLFFKYDLTEEEIASSDLIFICVNTPSITEQKFSDNFDINSINNLINRGIQLSLDNVYSSLENICDAIINTNNYELIFRQRILIQKSTVHIETLKFMREFLIGFFLKKYEIIKKISDEKLNIFQNPRNKNSDFNLNTYFFINNKSNIENFIDKFFLLVNIPEFLAEGN